MSDTATLAYPFVPGHKETPVETSREAASAAASTSETLHARILKFMQDCDCSADACAAALGQSILSIRPRFSELHRMGRIEPTARRVKNESGHSAVVWRLRYG